MEAFVCPGIMPQTRRQYKAQQSALAKAGIDKPGHARRLSSVPRIDTVEPSKLGPLKATAEAPKSSLGQAKTQPHLSEVDDGINWKGEQKTSLSLGNHTPAACTDFADRSNESLEPPSKAELVPCERDIEDIEFFPSAAAPNVSRARKVTQLLRRYYRGDVEVVKHPKTTPRTILDSLIATILSQATSNTNSSRAFATLKESFPTWEAAISSGPAAIEDAIRIGGLAQNKSRVIHNILTQLQKNGECSLEHLRNLSDNEVKQALCAFKGVGPKTAACVLMFAMRRDEFPVDTHVCRISGRLGWMPRGSTPEKTYQVLNECLPDDIKYDLHVLLVEHGRKICKAQKPLCEKCPLAPLCPSANVGREEEDEE